MKKFRMEVVTEFELSDKEAERFLRDARDTPVLEVGDQGDGIRVVYAMHKITDSEGTQIALMENRA